MHEPADAPLPIALARAQRLSMVLQAALAAAVLLAWQWPAAAAVLPVNWHQMQAPTALSFLLVLPAMALERGERGSRRAMLARVCALLILLPAGDALVMQAVGGMGANPLHWVAPELAPLARPMSLQSAGFMLLLVPALLARPPTPDAGFQLGDAPVLGLLALVLVVVAGYTYGAVALFGQTFGSVTSPQTLVCMALSTFVLLSGRTRSGYFSILSGTDIGSRLARFGMPLALALPFLIIVGSVELSATGWLSPPYASALMSTVAAVLLLLCLIALARRLNELVGMLRRSSLTDELTRLPNRRAFYLMGQHALSGAQRAGAPLTVLFIDLDGLKQVNDQLGHQAGSALLVDAAELLRGTFRAADLVARLGGDEFAVVSSVGPVELQPALERLERATAAANARGRPWVLRYSLGVASLGEAGEEPFDELVARADARMYDAKRAKRVKPSP